MSKDSRNGGESCKRTYTAIIERCPDTGLYAEYVPGLPSCPWKKSSLPFFHSVARWKSRGFPRSTGIASSDAAHYPQPASAHSLGETIDELKANLSEVIEMLLEDGEPTLESEFIGTQTVQVG